MRIALILLSILALVFIGSISWSLIGQGWGLNLKRNTDTMNPSGDSLAIETWKNQIKTDEKIEQLSSLVKQLAAQNGVSNPIPNNTNTGWKSIEVSGKLLALLMPTVTLTQIDNAGIFDLHIFDTNTPYSTYQDVKLGLTLIVTRLPYDTFLKNIQAVGEKVYSPNEKTWFPFRSFYLNPPKADTVVRLVIEMEWETIGIEIPKTKFSILKELLLGRNTTPAVIQKIPVPVKTNKPKPTGPTKTGTTITGTGKILSGTVKTTH